MNHDGLTTATMLLLAAFAVDRVASGIIFLLFRPKPVLQPEGSERRNWSRKLCYSIIAAVLTLTILIANNKVRLLQALGMSYEAPWDGVVDLVLTFLVLVGGAERLSTLLQAAPAPSTSAPEPLEVTGTISVVESQENTRSKAAGN